MNGTKNVTKGIDGLSKWIKIWQIVRQQIVKLSILTEKIKITAKCSEFSELYDAEGS